jgi:NAD(P)H-hydrate epimerase
LVIAGSRGKTGAAALSGLAALRAGAGLVTVASAESAISIIASYAPELMTAPLPETASGGLAEHAFEPILRLAERKNIVALGPGLGADPETVDLVRRLYSHLPKPMVIDADGLNALAGGDWIGNGQLRILTPHPGEMSRLTGKDVEEIQNDRVAAAREFAVTVNVQVILKGNRTLIAEPNAQVLVNPTGSPAMATGGTGDVLTGLAAGLIAQSDGSPEQVRVALAAAVYLHGLSGGLGAKALGEQCLIATDLLRFLPEAMGTVRKILSHE